MSEPNPFKSPLSDPPARQLPEQVSAVPRQITLLSQLKPIFIRWEILRLVFNFLCICGVLSMMAIFDRFPTTLISDMDSNIPLTSWLEYAFAGFIANVCFTLGPIADSYLTWLGAGGRKTWLTLFTLGTLFTLATAGAAISGLLF